MESIGLSEVEMGLKPSILPEPFPKNETTIEKVHREIERVQIFLKSSLKLDQLTLEYTDDTPSDWGAAAKILDVLGKRWGLIHTGRTPSQGTEFLRTAVTNQELANTAHELGHLVTCEEVNSGRYPVNIICAEGISTLAEIDSMNSELPESEKINPITIQAHCQRIVEENKDNFLAPGKTIGLDSSEDLSDIYITTLESPQHLEYDGFNRPRDYEHIAGISFVFAVLKDEAWKWPVLFKNPPTMDEIISPQKYLDRVGGDLDAFKPPEITPILPVLNPSNNRII